jgi:hypothetical protein
LVTGQTIKQEFYSGEDMFRKGDKVIPKGQYSENIPSNPLDIHIVTDVRKEPNSWSEQNKQIKTDLYNEWINPRWFIKIDKTIIKIIEQEKVLSNNDLLLETMEAMSGDDYDGCFTDTGQFIAFYYGLKLRERLKDWLDQ